MRDLLEKEKGAYRSQRHAAYKRKIKFNLTFDQWHFWWVNELGSNWFKLRGRKTGQFCMARFGDVGAYELGNIKCITVGENHSEWLRPNINLIRKIYQSKDCPLHISKKYKVALNIVSDIRLKRSWANVTAKMSHGGDCPCKRIGINARKCPKI